MRHSSTVRSASASMTVRARRGDSCAKDVSCVAGEADDLAASDARGRMERGLVDRRDGLGRLRRQGWKAILENCDVVVVGRDLGLPPVARRTQRAAARRGTGRCAPGGGRRSPTSRETAGPTGSATWSRSRGGREGPRRSGPRRAARRSRRAPDRPRARRLPGGHGRAAHAVSGAGATRMTSSTASCQRGGGRRRAVHRR